MADPILERAPLRLGRLLQAAPINVVHPAVERTPQAPILDPTVRKGRQAVGAPEAEQPHPTVDVAEHDEVLPQEADGFRLATGLEVVREARRDPVAAKPVTARGFLTHLADQIVLFFGQHYCLLYALV